jgi:hypothetical protein
LTRRFGGGRLNPNSSSSGGGGGGSNNNPSSSDLGGERGVSGGDSRKSTYRIRDHRWYDSYRDEIFSNSSSSHHHNHHSHHSHQRGSNTNSSGGSSGHHHNNESRSGDANATSHHDSQFSKLTKSNLTNTFSFGDKLQFWPDKSASGDKALFSKIASIYSELIAVSKHDGQLHQWKWSSDTPFVSKINLNTNLENTTTSSTSTTDHPLISLTIFHPKVLFLQLLNERICDVSTATVRASCWTESGKVKWKFLFIKRIFCIF